MAIEVQIEFIAKTTIRVVAYVYNDAGTLVNPTTSIKLTLTDKDGTKQVDAQAMSLISTGIYEYFCKTTTSSVKGWWTGEVVTVDGVDPDDRTSVGVFSIKVK